MAINDLTGLNIQDTYHKLVQTDGVRLADGTGSLLPIEFNENHVIISGTLTAQSYIVSESIIAVSSGSTVFGNSLDDTHSFTGSLSITGSGIDLRGNNDENNIKIHGTQVVGRKSTGLNHFVFGTESYPVTMSAFGLNINSDLAITVDSNFGQVDFADSGDVSVQINTSNGNISSSGTITANEFNIEGHITASGNISASGNIYADNVYASSLRAPHGTTDYINFDSEDTIFIQTSAQNKSAFSESGVTFNYNGSNDMHFTVKGDSDLSLIKARADHDKVGIGIVPDGSTSKLHVNGDFTTTSHITASNISSSGELIGIIDGGSF